MIAVKPVTAENICVSKQESDLSFETYRLTQGLDYYKPTMSQLAFQKEPIAEVTFTFHNRGQNRFADYIDLNQLQNRFDTLRYQSWSDEELNYLASIQDNQKQTVFQGEYLGYLKEHQLPPVEVVCDQDCNDLMIETTGEWALSTFWETIVMSELNEAYFNNYLVVHNLDPFGVFDEGDRRLTEKIELLKANPDIKIADFGTRRHFSMQWQNYVLGRLINECPNSLIGTSNVALANSLGIKPIGTFAHELPMVYAALADARGQDVRGSHNKLLQDWYDQYGQDYSVALTDTFTTDFFFKDFTKDQAKIWNGVRQDSGDPFEFGENLIKFYQAKDIDPQSKTVVFSDGLDIESIIALQKHFSNRIKIVFGWGTNLMNDLGIKPLNVVMKATHVRLPDLNLEADTVKLSDEQGKHIGPSNLVERYQYEFGQ